MGSEFWRQPAKRLDREFRSMDAVRVERTSRYVAYRFPDGARIEVPTNVGPGNARTMLMRLQERYGVAARHTDGDPLGGTIVRDGIPTIDPDRVVMSRHATERFDQMNTQARLAAPEILHAIQYPETVRYSPANQSWMWVRGRIAVATSFDEDTGSTVIRTILWATAELWAQNPRPEQASA